MKGVEELEWAFINIALLLIFVTWAINPVFNSIQQAQQNSARLNAQEIAGVINTMEASNSDMTYMTFLPPLTCTVEINGKFVKFDIFVNGKHQIEVMDILQTPLKIVADSPSFDCKKGAIQIQKQGSLIRVS